MSSTPTDDVLLTYDDLQDRPHVEGHRVYWDSLTVPNQIRRDTVLPKLRRVSERFSIVKLELRDMLLTGTEVHLVEVVANNTNLTHLDLSINWLQNEGATLLHRDSQTAPRFST
jgi:hypothetical protein